MQSGGEEASLTGAFGGDRSFRPECELFSARVKSRGRFTVCPEPRGGCRRVERRRIRRGGPAAYIPGRLPREPPFSDRDIRSACLQCEINRTQPGPHGRQRQRCARSGSEESDSSFTLGGIQGSSPLRGQCLASSGNATAPGHSSGVPEVVGVSGGRAVRGAVDTSGRKRVSVRPGRTSSRTWKPPP